MLVSFIHVFFKLIVYTKYAFLFFSVASEIENAQNIAMYVGLFVAIAVFITVLAIIIFLIRRKGRDPGVYDYGISEAGR